MHDVSDEELIRAARRGDSEALARLLRRHMQASWGAAFALSARTDIADDAVQDAFERVVRYLGSYDDQRPFRPWLHRIVVNCTLTLIQQRTERREDPLDAHPLLELEAGALEANREAAEAIRVIATLPPERRAVIVLRTMLGYSAEEVSDILETPVGTVHSRLSRALADVRRRLEVSDVS